MGTTESEQDLPSMHARALCNDSSYSGPIENILRHIYGEVRTRKVSVVDSIETYLQDLPSTSPLELALEQ